MSHVSKQSLKKMALDSSLSREELGIHVHVSHTDGEAKFWLTPEVIIAVNYGLSDEQINVVRKLVILHYEEITNAWNTHFSD
jgi:hypothetical protein